MICTAAEMSRTIQDFANGTDERYTSFMFPKMLFTEGMRVVAEKAGAFWLVELIGLRMAPLYAAAWLEGKASIGVVKLQVDGGKAEVVLTLQDDEPPAFSESISPTTFPEGEWLFFLGTDPVGPDEYVSTLYLPSEH